MLFGFLQTDIVWEDAEANLHAFEEKIAALEILPNVLILPEMFNAGFSFNYAEPKNFLTYKWMIQMAERYNIVIAGSIAVKDLNQKFNRFLWVFPDGKVEHYDKRHLFAHGGESESFSAGKLLKTIIAQNFKIRPMVCYDLRFPVWSRNTQPYYDVLVYTASWPIKRIETWKTLLKARAIENQSYVIGVNRIGTDGNGLIYSGQSMIIDFKGNVIVDAHDTEGYFSAELSLAKLHDFRNHYQFLEDGDGFEMN